MRQLFPCMGLLLAAFGLLASCKRLDGDTICEGTVVDRNTNACVAGATIGVYQFGSSGGGFGGGYGFKETHTADAQGHFSFRVNDDSEDLILRAFTDLGHYTIYQEAPRLRGGRNNKGLQLKVQAPAWIRAHLIDELPHDTANVSFWGFSGAVGSGLLLPGNESDIIMPAMGNWTSRVNWDINRIHIGLLSGGQDVFCKGIDTVVVEIRY